MNSLISIISDISITKSNVQNLPMNDLTHTNVENIIHLVLALAGAIAVLIIIIAGLQYVVSQGNPQSAAKAKDTIIYALVGLVICAIGYGVVSFVVSNI